MMQPVPSRSEREMIGQPGQRSVEMALRSMLSGKACSKLHITARLVP